MSSSLLAPPAEAESAIMTDASPAKITRWRRDSPPRIPPRISSPSLISREHDEDSGAPLPHPALEARPEVHSAAILVVSPHSNTKTPPAPDRVTWPTGYPLLIELMHGLTTFACQGTVCGGGGLADASTPRRELRYGWSPCRRFCPRFQGRQHGQPLLQHGGSTPSAPRGGRRCMPQPCRRRGDGIHAPPRHIPPRYPNCPGSCDTLERGHCSSPRREMERGDDQGIWHSSWWCWRCLGWRWRGRQQPQWESRRHVHFQHGWLPMGEPCQDARLWHGISHSRMHPQEAQPRSPPPSAWKRSRESLHPPTDTAKAFHALLPP